MYLDKDTDKDTQNVLDILQGMNLEQHVHEPTHVHGYTFYLVITRSYEAIVNDLHTEAAVLSDHASIVFKLPWSKPKPCR